MNKLTRYVSMFMVLIMMLSTLHLSVLAGDFSETAVSEPEVSEEGAVLEEMDSAQEGAVESEETAEIVDTADTKGEEETDASSDKSSWTENYSENGENNDDYVEIPEEDAVNELPATDSIENNPEEDYVYVKEEEVEDLSSDQEETNETEMSENVEPGRMMNDALLSSDGSEDTVSVTLNANGGLLEVYDEEIGEWTTRESTVILVPKGEILWDYIPSPDSTDPDYYFVGWSETEDGENIVNISNTSPESDMTLYAKWGKYKHIEFDANGGFFPENCSDETNDDRSICTLRIPEDATVQWPSERPQNTDDRLTFRGWSDQKDGDLIIPYRGYGYDYSPELVMEDGATYYAVWGEYVTVTLNANGGFFEVYDEETGEYISRESTVIVVPKGEELWSYIFSPESSNPDDYFAGWSETENGEINNDISNTRPESDMTLYAKWGKYKKIEFDANGGFFPENCSDETNDDRSICTLRITEDATVQWPSELPRYTDDSLTFRGWSDEKGGEPVLPYRGSGYSYSPELVMEDGATYYAVWGEPVTVTLNANGGSFEVYDEETGEYISRESTEIVVPKGEELWSYIISPESSNPDDYFAGWSETENGEIIDDISNTRPESGMTFYAKWGKYKKIKFDANGGFFSEVSNGETNDDRNICTLRSQAAVDWPSEQPHYTDDSLTFRGWSDEKDGEPVITYNDAGYSYPSEHVMEDGATYYAVWGESVTVTLNANGGSFEVYDEETGEYISRESTEIVVPKGEELWSYIISPESSNPDDYFAGWSETENGEIIDDISNTSPESDMTLYAKWGKYNKRIEFDANGGVFPENCNGETNDDRSICTLRTNADVDTPSEPPHYKDDSMSFRGWSDEKDGEPIVHYSDGYSIPSGLVMEDGATYYAVWGKTVTVTLNANGGYFKEWNEENEEYENVSTIQIKCAEGTWTSIPEPSHDGTLSFVGWSNSPNDDNANAGNSGCFNKDTTLYAVWTEPLIITFDLNGGYCAKEVYDEIQGEYQDHASVVKKKILPGQGIDLDEDVLDPSVDDPQKAFAGWSLSKDGKILNDDTPFLPEESCTLYAVWKDAYVVTFDMNGGYCDNELYDDVLLKNVSKATVLHQKIVPGDTISGDYGLGPVIAESEKYFRGWSLTRNGEPVADLYDDYCPTESCTLYAVWGETCQITLDANGGLIEKYYYWKNDQTVSNVDTAEIAVEEYLELPGCESMYNADENLMFYGWSLTKNGEIIGDRYFYPTEACTLYAVWKAPITIKLDAMGGYVPESFNSNWDDEWPISEAQKSRYKVTESGMTIETAPGRYIYIPELENQDDSRVFNGWSLTKNGVPVQLDGSGQYYEVPGACTLYARWEPAYNVTLDAGEGYFETDDVGTRAKTIVKKIGQHNTSAYDAIAYVSIYNDEENRELLGWSLTPGGELVVDEEFYPPYRPSGDCTLYAVWGDVCTITYDANGGYFDGSTWCGHEYLTANHDLTMKVSYLTGKDKAVHPGEILSSDDPSLVFAGWSTDKTGKYVFKDDLHGGEAAFLGSAFQGDTTLYAIWKKPDCRVTIDCNGGYFNDSFFTEQKEIDAVIGKELEIETYDLKGPDNKSLAGFSLSKDSHTVVTGHNEDGGDGPGFKYYYTPSKTCTLYAVWEDPCEITFDANGGYFDGSFYDPAANWEYAEFRKSLTRHGVVNRSFDVNEFESFLAHSDVNKIFAGWSFSKDGEVDVEADASFSPTGDCTLYAVWQDTGKIPVTKITLSQTKLTLEKSETATLKAAAEPENATDKSVVWTSSNGKVATVDKNGKVTAVAKGTAVITAKAADQSGVQASCTVTVKETPTFSDVPSSYAFANEIKWAAENGIVSGYDDGTFKPKESCKRKQIVAFLWRMAGTPKPASLDARFKDVSTKTSFYKAIYWASEKKIVLGFGDGTFRPDDTCTRGQVVAFLWRMAGRPAPKATSGKFSDVSRSNSFYKAILWASENGIVKGYSDGTFKPDNNCTRAQIVTFIYRYKNLK